MSVQTIWLPKKSAQHIDAADSFNWHFGDNKKVSAKNIYFARGSTQGILEWNIEASLGTLDTQDLYAFSMILPFVGNEKLVGLYTLDDGLLFSHVHWFEMAPGFDGLKFVDAETATLNIIKYDTKTGIVEGTFEAEFKHPLYRMVVRGQFSIKQMPGKNQVS